MIVYRTFWFLHHNFGSIFVATTCRTNTGHVTRTNCYKPEAVLTTYSCEKDERSQIVVFAHYSLQRDCQSIPELLNSLFMSLCVSIGPNIFRCDHFRSINDMLLYRIWFYSTSSKSLFRYYPPLLSNLIRNTQRCVTLEGKQGTFHLYDVKFPSRPTPLWLI